MPHRLNLEIMTFRYLKTLVLNNFFEKLQHYLMFFIFEEYY